MNNNEILNKYIDLIDKGYCCDCNELNCIDNFSQAKITHAIRKLQQENKILKENTENNDKVVDKVNWENQLLKKHQDDFIKWLVEESKISMRDAGYHQRICLDILDKYQEIIRGDF